MSASTLASRPKADIKLRTCISWASCYRGPDLLRSREMQPNSSLWSQSWRSDRMAVFVGLEPLGTCACLIAQAGIVQHRPFQSRAGWQALDFVGTPCFEGAAVNRDRRADNGGPRKFRRVGGRRECRGHEERQRLRRACGPWHHSIQLNRLRSRAGGSSISVPYRNVSLKSKCSADR